MASSNSQRVAAFFLAALFLLTTVGATAYVLWQINQDEGVLVNETPEEAAAAAALAQQQEAQAADGTQPCGSGTFAAGEPRPTPSVTTADGTVSGLETIDVTEGTGDEVQPGDCVAALYYGTLATTGEQFDGNYDTGTPIEFSLTGVIPGWTEGIPGMKVGGVRRLVIPAAQAYGEQSPSEQIPANSDLIFEVEIINTRRGV